MANRMSTYSLGSNRLSTMQNTSQQVSTTTLLNALHNSFTSSQPYSLESSTSLVVNTWLSAAQTSPDGRVGGIVDTELARRAWEHARRRAEDAAIVLGSLHHSTPSLFTGFVSALPISIPGSFYTALDVLRPFLRASSPHNPSESLYSALSATFGLNLSGECTAASLSLSTSGIDTKRGLLEVPAEAGYRAFDVFYLLLAGSSSAEEREYLGLKRPEQYSLLRKSGSYGPPSYLPTADDTAAAEDFRACLKAIGIKGKEFNKLLCMITAVLRLGDGLGFLIDQDELEAICEEVEGLLELDDDVILKHCATEDREVLIAAVYEATVDWVIQKANDAIRSEMHSGRVLSSSSASDGGIATPPSGMEESDVSITVIDVPSPKLGKALALKTIFDDSTGINLEMKEDGVTGNATGSSVIRDMKDAVASVEADMDIMTGAAGRQREADLDRRQGVLEKIGALTEADRFLHQVLYPISGAGIVLGKSGRFHLTNLLASSRVWFHLCLHPSEDQPASINRNSGPTTWSAGSVSTQIRAWRLPEWANHRNRSLDYTADFDVEEFAQRYGSLGCQPGRDGVESFIMQRGWSNGEAFVGHERVWMREAQWWEAESMLDMKSQDPLMAGSMLGGMVGAAGMESNYMHQPENPFYAASQYNESRDDLKARTIKAQSMAPSAMPSAAPGDYGLGHKGDEKRDYTTYEGELDEELAEGQRIEKEGVTFGRRVWVIIVWMLTWPIPSFTLRYIGRMKRRDIRMAWREKLALVMLIALINAIIVFYIVEFGNLICPGWDKAWDRTEVSTHLGDNDFWVSHHGVVYDISKFWRLDHSGITGYTTSSTNMEGFAGYDMDQYVIPPLTFGCSGLVTDSTVKLNPNATAIDQPLGQHVSGSQATIQNSQLTDLYWYEDHFLTRMKEYFKGDLVWDTTDIYNQGQQNQRMWFILNNNVYDVSNYFSTLTTMAGYPSYKYFSDDITNLIQANPGGDISNLWLKTSNATDRKNTLDCLNWTFYMGKTDFRKTARCQVNNYILLAFTLIICTVILVKFLAALQFGGKRRPAQQDKFVICQVPAYTEGEDQLRKGLDSLTALAYDNKRKLICVICDGMIVGGGNDRPTPKIVLDILGVDPKIDPPALPFRSVGVGADQLNYGKVYSGLYEFEGNVVPYLVVVKVGRESEQRMSKPGNRGKRDSQILLMSFLNRVHHRSPMNPLELEMFHQINNVIGVDPELYEYLFMVDADTKVKEDSLNRLVAACAHDVKIAGICGETSLENEEKSWWTMIQVYEYYISHHLAKAFESLFGSVTCLPGCFCMYRLRTADKGRPLIISDKVIKEYAVNNLDTLHKKNLLSLGEDRYLTTLMTKHFPTMSYKFVPDAYALTEAPHEWSVLLSQRRRWINSTVHNLAELMFIKDLCGFCCFSMRFVVFVDLFGTIILPATFAYLVYLIYRVASHTGQFPLISIVLLAAVYGLQAVIFILKRQWQHVGWMIIYLLAYPIYSFLLPIYSFWKQDDFSWGNTRIVVGETGKQKVVLVGGGDFDPRSIPLKRWDNHAVENGLPGRRGLAQEKDGSALYQEGAYEMDEIRSVYSAKPASTILTGFPQQSYRAPQSPGQFNGAQSYQRYTDSPSRHMSMASESPFGMHPMAYSRAHSQDNLLSVHSPPAYASAGTRSPFGAGSRPASTNNLSTMSAFTTQGPTNEQITQAIRECLSEVDLDSVTKKQLKALAEQKLQCQLQGEKRAYLDSQIDYELANM